MTTTQESLFPALVRPVTEGLTIQESFLAFHEANPWVYRELVRMAREAVAAGRQRVGIKMLVEVLRWRAEMGTVDPSSSYKINNNLSSRFARLIMQQEPDLAEAFSTRELRAA